MKKLNKVNLYKYINEQDYRGLFKDNKTQFLVYNQKLVKLSPERDSFRVNIISQKEQDNSVYNKLMNSSSNEVGSRFCFSLNKNQLEAFIFLDSAENIINTIEHLCVCMK